MQNHMLPCDCFFKDCIRRARTGEDKAEAISGDRIGPASSQMTDYKKTVCTSSAFAYFISLNLISQVPANNPTPLKL